MATYKSKIPRVDKFHNGTWVYLDDANAHMLTFYQLAKLVNQNLIKKDSYLFNSQYKQEWHQFNEIDGLQEAINKYLTSPSLKNKETSGYKVRTAGDREQREQSKGTEVSDQGRMLSQAERARSAESSRKSKRSEMKVRARSYSPSSESSRSGRMRTRSKPHDQSRTSQSTANDNRKTSRSKTDKRTRSPESSKTKSVKRNIGRENQWKKHYYASKRVSNVPDFSMTASKRVSNVPTEEKENQDYHITHSMAKRGTRTRTLSTTKTSFGSGANQPGSPRKNVVKRPSFGPSIDERKRLGEPGRMPVRHGRARKGRNDSSSDEEQNNQEGKPRRRPENHNSISNASRVLNKPISQRFRTRRPSDTSTIVSNASIASTNRMSRLKKHPDLQERRKVKLQRELDEQKRHLQIRKAEVGLQTQRLEKLRSDYYERRWKNKYIAAKEKKDLLMEQTELKAFRTRLAEEIIDPSIFARSPVVPIQDAAGVLKEHEKLLSESVKERQQLHQDCLKVAQEFASVCSAVKHIYRSAANESSERDRYDPLLGSLLLLEKEKPTFNKELGIFSKDLQSGEVEKEVPKEPSIRGPKRQNLPAPATHNSSLHLGNMPSYGTGCTSDIDLNDLYHDEGTSDASEEGQALGKEPRYVLNLENCATIDNTPSPRDIQYKMEDRVERRYPQVFHSQERPGTKGLKHNGERGRGPGHFKEPGYFDQKPQTSRVLRMNPDSVFRKCKTERTKTYYRRKVEERWEEYGENEYEDPQFRTRDRKSKPNPLFTYLISDRDRDRYATPKMTKKISWSLDSFVINESTPSPPPGESRILPERTRRVTQRGREKNRERTSKSPKRVYRKRATENRKSKSPYGRRGRSNQQNVRGRKLYTSPSRLKKKSKSPAKKLKRKILERRQRNAR